MDYTIPEAMKTLGIGSRTTIYRKIKQGLLREAKPSPHIKGEMPGTRLDGESVEALRDSGFADLRRSSAIAVRQELARRAAVKRNRRAKRGTKP